jgi:predicted nucleotidyltransferase
MNIHFKDKETLAILEKSTLAKIKMGSHLYGFNDEQSDTDYLCITVPTLKEQTSFSFTHHQFQYKDEIENIDYIFVNLFNFIRNTINGDSTINFEVLHSEELLKTPLAFLYELKSYFINYPIIRSYLGLAKRDLNGISKSSGNRNKNKQLLHAYRGYYFAKYAFEQKFSTRLPSSLYDELLNLKLITDYKVRHDKIVWLKERVKNYRSFIVTELESNNIPRFMSIEGQQLLDEKLEKLIHSDIYQSKMQPSLNMQPVYIANEKGIRY